jgi:hypothetical protein
LPFTLDVLLFFLGFVSGGFSWCIAYLMLVSFRTLHREYLLGFPLGFCFLGFSFACFGISNLIALPANLAAWLSLFFGTYGYLYLSLSYALKGDGGTSSAETRRENMAFLALAVLTIIVVSTILSATPALPSYETVDIPFRVVNLALLGYIIFSISRVLRNRSELSSVVCGFTFLAIQQCAELMWALDRRFVWAFLFGQLVALVGTLILVIVVVGGFRSKETLD